MKIGTNLVLLGILSMLIGTAFASPLLISELEIRPFHEPLPKGPTADIIVSVVYANFSVGETSVSAVYNQNVTDISYFVVLNITNNSDEWADVNLVQFSAAQNITKGISPDSPFFGENSTSSKGWDAKGAWVDGKWYNLTWVPHNHFWMNCSAIIHGEEMWSEDLPMGEGYWMEGVQLMDKAVGGTVTNMYMNMNGTWIDVTGRVTWLDDNGNVVDINPERLDTHTSKAVTGSGSFFGANSTSSMGWDAKGAWVDGKWYNLTWVPHNLFWMNCSATIHGEEMWSEGLPKGEGYWMEGVQLMDKAVGGTVTNMYMNMNGTWVDVTGRVTWIDDSGNVVDINPERLDTHTSTAVTGSGTYFGEMLTFGIDQTNSVYDPDMDPGLSVTTYAPIEFNNLWAPHQSRLIALSGNRQVLAKLLDSSKIEQLKTEPVTFRGSVHSRLNDTVGVYDSNSVDDEIKQVQLELTEDGYLYNIILSEDQMFVMDSFGVEVFIEPRS